MISNHTEPVEVELTFTLPKDYESKTTLKIGCQLGSFTETGVCAHILGRGRHRPYSKTYTEHGPSPD